MGRIVPRETQDANRRFIHAAMRAPMLTRAHEAELARRWADERDEAALHEFVTSHTRLVVSLAIRFRGYGLPLGDLIQEGSLGLMQAAVRYDPWRQVRFSTYATWWIRAAIQDFVLRNWSIVRTGTTAAQKTLFFNLRRLRARIGDAGAFSLSHDTRSEIARDLCVEPAEVEAMEGRLLARDQSINAPRGARGTLDWQDLLVDERPSPEEVVIGLHDGAARERWLAGALRELSAREQRIIRARHMGEQTVTLDQLSRVFGISKERVRQIEHRALEKLARLMRHHADGAEAKARSSA